MIKNKKTLFIAIILFIASMILNFPFPHKSPFGETIASVFNIPVRSVNGLHYIGITSLVLLIVSLVFLGLSLKKYHGRSVLLAIIIGMLAPPMIAESFQKTLATGIYAVDYDRENSSCHFEMTDDTTLHGECELPFVNHSKKDVQFTVEFYDKYYMEDDIQKVSLMNNNAPYEVEIEGKSKKTIIIESDIDVSNMENHVEHGGGTFVNIIIKSGEKIRKL